jgi:hypothetical protein
LLRLWPGRCRQRQAQGKQDATGQSPQGEYSRLLAN